MAEPREDRPETPTAEGSHASRRPGSLAALPERKKEALDRLRTALGHARGIERMLEEDRYCIDVLKQLAAVQAQLGKIAHVLTRSHMELCLTEAIQAGRGDEHIDELAEVLRYLSAARPVE